MYVHKYSSMYVHTNMCVHMYVFAYICMYNVFMSVCTYIIGTLFRLCTVTIWTLYVCINVVRVYVNSTSVVHWIRVHMFPLLSHVCRSEQTEEEDNHHARSPRQWQVHACKVCDSLCTGLHMYMAHLVYCAYVCVCGTHCRDLRGRTGVICSTDDFFFQNGQ